MISEKVRTAQGMEGARKATGILCAGTALGVRSMSLLAVNPPDPEVPEKGVRRQFTAEYKLSILRQAEACRDERGIGALLRKEGLIFFPPVHLAPPEGYGDPFGFKAQAAES
jgi:transposase